MMDTQARKCKNCGYKVRFQEISDPHGPAVSQFVANIQSYPFDGRPAVTSTCPSCKKELTLESTQAV